MSKKRPRISSGSARQKTFRLSKRPCVISSGIASFGVKPTPTQAHSSVIPKTLCKAKQRIEALSMSHRLASAYAASYACNPRNLERAWHAKWTLELSDLIANRNDMLLFPQHHLYYLEKDDKSEFPEDEKTGLIQVRPKDTVYEMVRARSLKVVDSEEIDLEADLQGSGGGDSSDWESDFEQDDGNNRGLTEEPIDLSVTRDKDERAVARSIEDSSSANIRILDGISDNSLFNKQPTARSLARPFIQPPSSSYPSDLDRATASESPPSSIDNRPVRDIDAAGCTSLEESDASPIVDQSHGQVHSSDDELNEDYRQHDSPIRLPDESVYSMHEISRVSDSEIGSESSVQHTNRALYEQVMVGDDSNVSDNYRYIENADSSMASAKTVPEKHAYDLYPDFAILHFSVEKLRLEARRYERLAGLRITHECIALLMELKKGPSRNWKTEVGLKGDVNANLAEAIADLRTQCVHTFRRYPYANTLLAIGASGDHWRYATVEVKHCEPLTDAYTPEASAWLDVPWSDTLVLNTAESKTAMKTVRKILYKKRSR